MSHLKQISFNNFRSIQNKTIFDISPITFLTGPNSSGKSSLLKALLLLKSNYNSDLQVLDFSGPKHNLGTFDTTINRANKDNHIIMMGLQASISSDGFPFTFMKQPVTTKRSVYNILKEFNSKNNLDIFIELNYKRNERSGKLFLIEIYLLNDVDPFMRLEIGDITKDFHTLFINHEKVVKNKVLKGVFYENIIRDEFKFNKTITNTVVKVPINFSLNDDVKAQYFDEPILVFSKLFEKFIDEKVSLKVKREIHPFMYGQPLRRLLRDFASIVENTEYLEAVRANTKRIYTNDSQGTSFNEFILEYRSRDISKQSLEFTNKWLKKFDIADELIFENIEGVATTIYLMKNGDKIALADLGYGITQFLPILLKIALEEPITNNEPNDLKIVKKLILLEEPETNLHPRLQSLIADFLLDAIKTFEIRFIVETHSEYIIRKMQILTAEKKMTTKDTVIHYFNDSVEQSPFNAIRINLNENGAMSEDFGSGFFDEATNLKYQLLKNKIKQ